LYIEVAFAGTFQLRSRIAIVGSTLPGHSH
jgi:hypothetical protein